MELAISGNDFTKVRNNEQGQRLAEYSKKDSGWDKTRAITQELSAFLIAEQTFPKWGNRMEECTTLLGYGEKIDQESGEVHPKMVEAFFCHCRHCPICDGRRTLVRTAKFANFMPKVMAKHPKGRWLMLTLTIPNCPVTELRERLKDMNAAWNRLRLRKEFKPVTGWIRTTEVTQEAKRGDYAHPHFHILLLVPPSWFGVNYVRQSAWVELWRSCMRDENISAAGQNIKAVKGSGMAGAVEVIKAFSYSIKVDELIKRSPGWMIEYMKQVQGLRFIASGGVLKEALKDLENSTDAELINVNDENELEKTKVLRRFSWRPSEKIYRKSGGDL